MFRGYQQLVEFIHYFLDPRRACAGTVDCREQIAEVPSDRFGSGSGPWFRHGPLALAARALLLCRGPPAVRRPTATQFDARVALPVPRAPGPDEQPRPLPRAATDGYVELASCDSQGSCASEWQMPGTGSKRSRPAASALPTSARHMLLRSCSCSYSYSCSPLVSRSPILQSPPVSDNSRHDAGSRATSG